MKKKTKKPFPFGSFLKELRVRKGVSLKKVEDDTGFPVLLRTDDIRCVLDQHEAVIFSYKLQPTAQKAQGFPCRFGGSDGRRHCRESAFDVFIDVLFLPEEWTDGIDDDRLPVDLLEVRRL